MEKIKFNGMDNLLPSVEQAKLIGLIKTPPQIENEQKLNYALIGIGIGITIILIGGAYYMSTKKKKEDKN